VTRRPAASAPPAALAALLAAGADGALADMAAIQLLTSHRYWLTRTDFTTPFIRADRSPLSGQALAHVRWRAAARALTAGQLPCTGSEAAILQIAAGLAAGLPVRLRDAVTGLDHANLTAVAAAIMAAGGHHLP
jgi:hypothetical protein